MTGQSLTTLPQESGAPVPAEPQPRLPIKQSSRQVRHLAQAIQLEETGTAPLVRFTMFVATSAVIVFLVWSALTTIDEVATADGTVIPAGSVTSVQHLEGGIVEAILVKEGELVDLGQPLIRMSPAAAMGDLEQTRAREAALLLKAERLRAFAEGREPDFSFIGPGFERLVADNKAIYHTQQQSAETSRAVTLARSSRSGRTPPC
jgi:HlyD family secretion protein/adhesin transport system membrane fusion protein